MSRPWLDMSDQLRNAKGAYAVLQARLPAATQRMIEARLAGWQRQLIPDVRASLARPQLVMRPFLPPRPLHKHYFKVVQNYD